MIKTALSVENLCKVYLQDKKKTPNINALNNITLEVKQGEIFGLLGPNGAGKTTFLSILAGTVIKTNGKVNVWGFDLDKNPRQVKASIGIVPQEVNLDAFFTRRSVPNESNISENLLELNPFSWTNCSNFSFVSSLLLLICISVKTFSCKSSSNFIC